MNLYEAGFMSKMAEYGIPYSAGVRMMKLALSMERISRLDDNSLNAMYKRMSAGEGSFSAENITMVQ